MSSDSKKTEKLKQSIVLRTKNTYSSGQKGVLFLFAYGTQLYKNLVKLVFLNTCTIFKASVIMAKEND